MIAKNKTIKSISALLVMSILMPSFIVFFSPKKAEATLPVVDYALNAALNPPTWTTKALTAIGVPSTLTNTLTNSKSFIMTLLREVLKIAAKRVLARMTQATINWINSDFHGSPLFLTNPSSFFRDIAKSEIRNLVDMIGYDSFKYPFGQQIALNIINSYKRQLADNAQYSLSKVINDPDLLKRYRNDFNYGGWNGFLVNTQYPQNNYIGFESTIMSNLARKLEGTVQAPAQKMQGLLQQGMGFLSPQTCPTNPAYNNGINEFVRPSFTPQKFDFKEPTISNPVPRNEDGGEEPSEAWTTQQQQYEAEKQRAYDAYQTSWNTQVSADSAKWTETNTCPGGLKSTTPGAVAANQVFSALNVPFLSTALDGALGNSLAAIFDALINHFIDKGLNGLAETISPSPSNDNWSYDGNSLSGTNTTSGGVSTLRIPQNVSATVGQITNTMISGGTGPYTIVSSANQNQPQPNTSIATVQISNSGSAGPKLTVTGITPGQTFVVIKDSSSVVQTARVDITIYAVGALVVIPHNISTNLTIPITATISGGQEPYVIQRPPNEAVAIVAFAGSNLIVNGVGRGNTFIVIEDSSTPIKKTTTVQIAITGPDDLNIPENITANVGQVTSVPILGGLGPYRITDQQDVRIATGQVFNAFQDTPATLKITGIKEGVTVIMIQDSSSPVKIMSTSITVIDAKTLLVTPPNVSANIDQTTNMTISGGMAPYAIETIPDSTIATAQISGPNLTVAGKATGQTTMIIKDSSTPTPKTITVLITIGALSVVQNVTVNANESRNITITGGTKPYSIETPPNTTVATVQISTTPQNSNIITITGKAKGQTGIVVKDSSTPPKSTGIQITVN